MLNSIQSRLYLCLYCAIEIFYCIILLLIALQCVNKTIYENVLADTMQAFVSKYAGAFSVFIGVEVSKCSLDPAFVESRASLECIFRLAHSYLKLSLWWSLSHLNDVLLLGQYTSLSIHHVESIGKSVFERRNFD